MSTKGNMTPTEAAYGQMQTAFSHFNKTLFQGRLREVLITLPHHRSYYGYFWADKFEDKIGSEKLDEIALNPDLFKRGDAETLSTLVHEMTHLEQQMFGKPGKNGNHNKAWGALMKAVGLYPSSTGMEGGKETGRKVSHYILPDGPFARSCEELLKSGWSLQWISLPAPRKESKSGKRIKYECPSCDTKAWAKKGAHILCGDCSDEENHVHLYSDDNDDGEED